MSPQAAVDDGSITTAQVQLDAAPLPPRSPEFSAWCFSLGVIFMGAETPPGAIEIVRGPEHLVRSYLQVVADASAIVSDVLVVPGMFEAPDVTQSYAVLRRWLGWCATKDGSGLLEWNVSGRTAL